MPEIDLANRTAKFKTRKGEMEIALPDVIEMSTVVRLALLGAVGLLERAADPESRWERIKAGNFGRPLPEKLPDVVHAISRVTNQPVGVCWEQWRAMTRTAKAQIRKDKSIRKALIDLEPEDVSQDQHSGTDVHERHTVSGSGGGD